MKAGDADASPSNIFKAQFIDPLKGFLNGSPESVVLMVPSVKDLISNHVAFPQPELDAGLFELHPVSICFISPKQINISGSMPESPPTTQSCQIHHQRCFLCDHQH